jgi:predicted aldo/keto reductase-like oxidoreductase
MKERGLIRNLGFSTHGHLDTILRLIATGVFDYVNLWYSYIHQGNWPAIVAARAQDMGVFIISPNDKGGKLYQPPERLRALTAPLSPMTFNDLFILRNPEIHTISCGASRPGDLDEHQQAVDRLESLDETVSVLTGRMNAALAEAVGVEWQEPYAQGLPEWQETPGQTNVPIILWLWNLVQAFDLLDYARFRYNLLGTANHWFPGNKVDAVLPKQEGALREALAHSPHGDRIIDTLYRAHALLDGSVGARLGSD